MNFRSFLYQELTLKDFEKYDKKSFQRIKRIVVPYIKNRAQPKELLCKLLNDAWFITSLILKDIDSFWADFSFYNDLMPQIPIDGVTGYPDYYACPDRDIVLSIVYYLLYQELEVSGVETTLDIIKGEIVDDPFCSYNGIFDKINEIFEDGAILDESYFQLRPILMDEIKSLNKECLESIVVFFPNVKIERNTKELISKMNASKDVKIAFIDRLIELTIEDDFFLWPNIVDDARKEYIELLGELRETTLSCEDHNPEETDQDETTFIEWDFPVIITDENGETIISRTALGINNKELNPYDIDWCEVTLLESRFVEQFLELIDEELMQDVADAIDDYEKNFDAVNCLSNSYKSFQGESHFYSYSYVKNDDNISAKDIAQKILTKRRKRLNYLKKINKVEEYNSLVQKAKEEKREKNSNAAAIETFEDLIQLNENQKQKLLIILHERITIDTRPNVIGKLLRYCKEKEWLRKTPSEKQFEKEFSVGKNWSSISSYFAERNKGCTKGINIEL